MAPPRKLSRDPRAFSCAFSASWRASSSILFFFCSRASTGNKAAASEMMALGLPMAGSATRLTKCLSNPHPRCLLGKRQVTSPASARHFALRPLLPAWHRPRDTGSLLFASRLPVGVSGRRGGRPRNQITYLSSDPISITATSCHNPVSLALWAGPWSSVAGSCCALLRESHLKGPVHQALAPGLHLQLLLKILAEHSEIELWRSLPRIFPQTTTAKHNGQECD